MLREDYNKLISLQSEFSGPYFLQVPGKDNDYYFNFSKLRNCKNSAVAITFRYALFNQGIGLNIFPYSMMTYCILMAGGVGNRVGAGRPKRFGEVLGKPVIAYTMQRLQQCSEIDHIVLSCVNGYQPILQKIADDNGISKVIKIVTGGKDYEHSIINGVEGLKGIAKDDDVVMMHWAASPFVSDEILKDNIRVCKEKGNAMSACFAFLLYGTNDGDHAQNIIDRETFKTLSAPQSFLYKDIVEFYCQVEEKHLFDTVEAHTTSLMAALNWPIYFSKGDQTNIKITTPEDLKLFEGYVLYEQAHADDNK